MLKEIIKNSKEFKEVQHNVATGKLSHAMLFVSSDQDYLSLLLSELQKLILCENKSGDSYCNNCPICTKINSGVAVDIEVVSSDNGIKVDDITEVISKLYVRPYEASHKIITIKNIDGANEAAQNKLLKSLEEPPAHVIFLLTASSTNKLLQTILSRVQKYEIDPLEDSVIAQFLTSSGVADAEKIAYQSGGSIQEANRLSTGEDAKTIYSLVLETMRGLRSTTELVSFVSKIEKHKDKLAEILDLFEIFTQDAIRCRAGGKDLVSKSNLNDAMSIAKEFSLSALLVFNEAVLEAKKMNSFFVTSSNIIDQLLLKLLEVKFKCR